MLYYTWFMGSTTLGYCDFIGEKLAWWFGITSPKYYYEIQEFERMKEEEEEEERQRKVNEHGWSNVSFPEDHTNPSSEQPKIELQGESLVITVPIKAKLNSFSNCKSKIISK